MIAVLFFVAVGILIGVGGAYPAAFRAGYRRGTAKSFEQQINAALRLDRVAGRQVAGEGVWPRGHHFEGECWEPPLYDIEAER